MFRKLMLVLLAAVLVGASADARIVVVPLTPLEKMVRAEIVVIGTITAVEKDTVVVRNFNGDKVAHKVALLKIDKKIQGADAFTHIRVAFVALSDEDPKVFIRPPGRGGYQPVNLAVGHAGVFFLTKDADSALYMINPTFAPLDAKAEDYKAEEEVVTKAAEVLADPMKALKSAKADARYFAANVLVTKYRRSPVANSAGTELVPLAESQAILKALAEKDWRPGERNPGVFSAYNLFDMLDLTEKDGWKYPMLKPGEDFLTLTKDAYLKWLDGPGKDYRIKKLVPKKAEKP